MTLAVNSKKLWRLSRVHQRAIAHVTLIIKNKGTNDHYVDHATQTPIIPSHTTSHLNVNPVKHGRPWSCSCLLPHGTGEDPKAWAKAGLPASRFAWSTSLAISCHRRNPEIGSDPRLDNGILYAKMRDGAFPILAPEDSSGLGLGLSGELQVGSQSVKFLQY